MKIRKALLSAAVAAAMVPMASHAAITWAWNYAGLNQAEGYAPAPGFPSGMPAASADMNELKVTGESIIHWKSGIPFATGSKFDDYILIRVDQFNCVGCGGIETGLEGPNYGSGTPASGFFPAVPGNHEFSLSIKISGTQTSATTYRVDSMDHFSVFYDSGDNSLGGPSYTATNFANASSAVDGFLAEAGFLISGNGANTLSGLPDGSIGLVVGLVDQLNLINGGALGTTELIPQRTGYTPIGFAIGLADGNNNLCSTDGGTATCEGTEAGLKAHFGISGVSDALTFHTRTDGSFQKTVPVPEPGTLALVGVAMLGLAAGRRRIKST